MGVEISQTNNSSANGVRPQTRSTLANTRQARADSQYRPPRVLRDAQQLSSALSNVHSAALIRHQSLGGPALNYSQGMARVPQRVKAGNFSRPLGRIAAPLQAGVDLVHIGHAIKHDYNAGDRFATQTTRVSSRAVFGILATGAAVVSLGAMAIPAAAVLPAVGLVVGAGMAGAAIGDEIGKAIVDFRKWRAS